MRCHLLGEVWVGEVLLFFSLPTPQLREAWVGEVLLFFCLSTPQLGEAWVERTAISVNCFLHVCTRFVAEVAFA